MENNKLQTSDKIIHNDISGSWRNFKIVFWILFIAQSGFRSAANNFTVSFHVFGIRILSFFAFLVGIVLIVEIAYYAYKFSRKKAYWFWLFAGIFAGGILMTLLGLVGFIIVRDLKKKAIKKSF